MKRRNILQNIMIALSESFNKISCKQSICTKFSLKYVGKLKWPLMTFKIKYGYKKTIEYVGSFDRIRFWTIREYKKELNVDL